jgi:uncharacterized protein YndB with AHSA1/START domain
MSVVTATIEIAADPMRVWMAAMTPENTPVWVSVVRGVGEHSDGDFRVGYEMEQRLCLRGVPFTVNWKLTACDAPHYARWEGRGPARSKAITEDWLTPTDDGGTHFEYRNEFKAPLGPLGSVASRALVGGVPEREAKASLAELKRRLEAGEW